jgi:uncharacterized membrane protein YagU involved in acid resistance
MSSYLVSYLLTALVAGVLGGIAMEAVMWIIARAGLARGDMILALGSMITKRRQGAYRVGLIIHVSGAFAFALLYTQLMETLGFTTLPSSLLLGLAAGFFHGLIVSLMIVWVVADQHPLEEFKEADLLVGISHVAGHVAYGAVVGLIVGLAPI